MKRTFFAVFLVVIFSGFQDGQRELYPPIFNGSFDLGEVLTYRVSFGIFTVGKAITKVDPKILMINGRPCYKIDGFGSTENWVSWLAPVDDQWGAYVDTAALLTHVSYRKIKENHYRKDEFITFDHENRKAEVKVKNKQTGVFDPPKFYDTPEHVRDLVGGFAYLRVIDFNKYKKKDTIYIGGFFEDKAYMLKILYDGKERVKTKWGKIRCHRLIPVVPDNKLFDGANSITTWISDDKNQIPIKIQAKMFIGSTGLELDAFSGLRNSIKISQ
jgi:Protein of unknown function (DUF3108)